MAGRYWRAACVVLVAGLACLPARADEPAPPGVLEVRGEAGKPLSLSVKEWAKLPRDKVEIKGPGDQVSIYEGVPLVEVLRLAGVAFEEHPRGRGSAYVLVEGADGYRAVLALAEVDPKVADRVFLLADRLDGKPLPDGAGPRRLIVPGDKVPVRWVKQVVLVAVQRPPERAKGKE
jgi:DMSO/TMAO reductase YedYZ molybdopterin-dependent catalytic subunit